MPPYLSVVCKPQWVYRVAQKKENRRKGEGGWVFFLGYPVFLNSVGSRTSRNYLREALPAVRSTMFAGRDFPAFSKTFFSMAQRGVVTPLYYRALLEEDMGRCLVA